MRPLERIQALNREIPCSCDLSIYIPCLNEQGNVGETMETVIGVCNKLGVSFELLVVDDGSTDGTVKEAQAVQNKYPDKNIRIFSNPQRRGLARNYVDSAYVATGRHFMMACGDNSEPPEAFEAIISKIGQADMIIPVFNAKDNRKFSRRFLSKNFVRLINLISDNDIDYYNGIVIHRRSNVMRWHADTDSFAYQAEIITRLVQEGASYMQVEVENRDRMVGSSTALSFKNLMGVGHTFLQIALRRLRVYLFNKGKPKVRREVFASEIQQHSRPGQRAG